MKNLLKLLGCGVCAFAIGCGDQPASTPPTPAMDPAKVQEMMKATTEKGAETAAGEKTEEATEKPADATEKPADEPKKDGDAPKEDAPKEDKKDDAKEEAAKEDK